MSRTLLVVLALGAALALGLALAASHRSSSRSSQADAQRYVIEVWDFFFDPPGLLIQPKETVEWVFREITVDGHTVTAYHPQNFRHELRIPETAQPFDSGIRDTVGDTFSLALDVLGVYDYFCLPHEFFGMVGRLIVKEPVGPGTQPVSMGLPEAAQKVMPSLEEIMGSVGLLFRLSAHVNGVVLDYERADEKALRVLDGILRDLKAGEGQEHSLFAVLQRVQLLDAVQEKLEELRTVLASGAALPEVLRTSKELKALLAEARKRLSS